MTSKNTEFQVPEEMRAMLEQGVTQARQGFDKVMSAAGEAVESIEGKSDKAKQEALELRRKSLAFTESSVAAAFDHAQKLVGAKSLEEVMKLQSEYMTRQFETVRGHVQEAGQEIQRRTKAVTEEMVSEGSKLQAKSRDVFEKGVEAAKNAAKPKK
jgi:phasin